MKKRIKILGVVGARPNFMKIAPLIKASRKLKNVDFILVHTNQHGANISNTFFKSLGIGTPHHTLKNLWKTPGQMLGSLIIQLEKVIKKENPDIVVVVGDVTSSLAGALAANKCGVLLAHVEAGLRSFDRNMPEEINRILIDELSDFLFVTEQSGVKNLARASGKVELVGNVMIDNLTQHLPTINWAGVFKKHGLTKHNYIVFTAHRPSNVDDAGNFSRLIEILEAAMRATGLPAVFPIHPRTQTSAQKHGLYTKLKNTPHLILTKPMDYIDFVSLVKDSGLVITDSGGIQEEAAYLKVPTVTLRTSTERPSTVDCGSNVLLSPSAPRKKIVAEIVRMSKKTKRQIRDVPLNDGKASMRILRTLTKIKL
jgi:UDP-N-acetylglucosamine 2-epimerase (non-hydrolysing)